MEISSRPCSWVMSSVLPCQILPWQHSFAVPYPASPVTFMHSVRVQHYHSLLYSPSPFQTVSYVAGRMVPNHLNPPCRPGTQ